MSLNIKEKSHESKEEVREVLLERKREKLLDLQDGTQVGGDQGPFQG